ncbi:MAG: NAD(P)/FAD-dependent oxidoreductase [Tepidanaerobacteraceae bacterium]|nr:FAD-dependent oxidoreductase [Thermoanaerobacterales bacterium]
MKYPKLYEPAAIGSLNLKNRIVLSPLHTNFTVDNKYTEKYIEYYMERAKGGVGLIISAHVMAEIDVDPYPITFGYPTLDSTSEIKYFAELTEGVHQYGAKIAIELSPGTGRLADEIIEGEPPVGPSEIPLLTMPDVKTRELTREEIKQLVESYGRAAGFAKQAGFDAIYVHFMAYLGDQFLSSCWNHRQDEYGGSLENRMRFLVECIESARSSVGEDFPLIVGLALDHGFPGGRELNETIEIAKKLESLKIDALHLRRGSYDAMNLIVPTVYMKEGTSVDYAYEVKKSVNIPIIVDGNLSDLSYCESILEEGKTDFIGMGRPFITDPHWPNKARAGKDEEILPCIRCMQCINRVFFARYSACSVNPQYGREYEGQLQPTSKAKQVLIAGGGPAGLTAAKFLAEKGHNVTLVEKSNKLGGHLLEAAVPAYKKETDGYLEWLIRQVKKPNIEIRLGTEVTPDFVLNIKPDAVVVCTGSVPQLPQVPGIDSENVKIATKLLENYTDVADNIVIVGAGLVGCEMALFLKEKGKNNITLIDILPEIAYDVIYVAKPSLLGELEQKGIKGRPGLKLKEVTSTGIIVEDIKGNTENIDANTVILATGLEADDNLYDNLQDKVNEIYKIGDCISPRKFIDAVHEAYAIAKII